VRDEIQYSLCALDGSVNVPWTGNAESWLANAHEQGLLDDDQKQKYVVCRFGNDSQLAAKAMLDRAEEGRNVKDIKNGFEAWRKEVDSSWPDY
jgi:adenylyltransferase/sulfurtransferase